jgi:DNA helicase HerA-like ATPase
MQLPPEHLGSFYLGAEYDLQQQKRRDVPISYDARDLTTHAVCVGMTGSGKTGLCVSLLEEAALDQVPALIIDPKGDVTNLLLQFSNLHAKDFEPWVNPDDARRKGQTIAEYAQVEAERWRHGLADWGIQGERIQALQESADYTIFTPGSEAGVPVAVLGALAAPKLDFAANAEEIRERIAGTVAALLGLVDGAADPVRSRQAILLSNILEYYWQRDQNVDLERLILAIQNPPVRKLGVLDVDVFYPAKERFALAVEFNSLMAAPTFQSWL